MVVESGEGVGKGKEVREVFGTEGEYPPLQRILSALHLFQDTVFPASNSLPFFHPNLLSSNVVPFYLVVLTTSRTPLLRSSDPLSVSRQASFVLPFLPLSLFLFPSSSPSTFDVAAYNSVFLLLTFFLRLPFFFSCLPLSFFFCLLPRRVSPPPLFDRKSLVYAVKENSHLPTRFRNGKLKLPLGERTTDFLSVEGNRNPGIFSPSAAELYTDRPTTCFVYNFLGRSLGGTLQRNVSGVRAERPAIPP